MACEAFEVELSALASGGLSAQDAARVEAHAAGCPACARELAESRALLGTLALPQVQPGPLGATTWARLAAKRERSMPRWAALLAVAAAVLAFGVWWLQPEQVAADSYAGLEEELEAEETALRQLQGLEWEDELAGELEGDVSEGNDDGEG